MPDRACTAHFLCFMIAGCWQGRVPALHAAYSGRAWNQAQWRHCTAQQLLSRLCHVAHPPAAARIEGMLDEGHTNAFHALAANVGGSYPW